MELWPAIDIREGRAVRLRQGDFSAETEFGDPLEVALDYQRAGADRLHLVDLDAARTGEPVNREAILRIVRVTGLMVQAGGGVRDLDAAAALLDHGVERVVVGTAAATADRQVLSSLCERWPGRIVVGLDYRQSRDPGGFVRRELAVRGWTEASGYGVEEALATLAFEPVAGLVVTDIRRDGTGVGPDVREYSELLALTAQPVIASGGISSTADIARLERLASSGRRLAGVIVGRALLSGAMTLADAKRAALGLTR